MKDFIKIALAATLVAGATAQPHAHQHRHAHAKKHEHGSPAALDKRSPAVAVVYETPVVTEYVYEGEDMDAEEAKAGIEAGLYRVVGESTPTFVAPSPSSTSTPISTSSTLAAQFFEVKSSSTPVPTTTSTPAPATTSTAAASSSSDTSSSTDGVDKEFQDGVHPCEGYFPSEYGAVPVDYLGFGGWLSLQQPSGGWKVGVAMNDIVQPTSGSPTAGTFASYRCPEGYGKTQWPSDQGATGQSIGGLYCGSDNKLHLSNTDRPQLCMKGAGGVKIVNKLSKVACGCQTNYPGDEKMSISLCPSPGETLDMFNPIETESYYWQGSPTSAQWYFNLAGLDAEDACCWLNSKYPTSAGNYAPMNAGTGQNADGTTFLSIFANSPSSTALLDYNVAITGDILGGPCAFTAGEGYTNGGTGCTVTLKEGGTAYFVFSN